MTFSRFTMLTVLLAAVLWALVNFEFLPSGLLQPDASEVIVIVLGGVTCLVYYFLLRPADPSSFTTNYLLTLVLKMVFFLALMGIMAFISSDHLTDNVIFGFLTYVSFTVLEVLALYRLKSRAGKG